MEPSFLVVVSERDPVAPRVAEEWGVPEATGERLDGAPFRRLGSRAWVVKRPVLHCTTNGSTSGFPWPFASAG